MTQNPLQPLEYDVCLSFAGEDREYVSTVAQHLDAGGVRVFYDAYEEVNLWGKDLYEHLDHIYKHAARFCVMFVSEHYARKLWTNHERKSAQERAFKENSEYILPARFDDTLIPGLRETVGYIDLRNKEPEELAQLLRKKVAGPGTSDHSTGIEPTSGVNTHRDHELRYEISYLPSWELGVGPGDSALFLKRKGKDELSVMHVNVANFTGDKAQFFSDMEQAPASFIEKFRKRFPDAEISEHGNTSLGSFPAYYHFIHYSISNLDITVQFVGFQIFGIYEGRIYLIVCEMRAEDFERVFQECRGMLATFNYR